MMKKILIIFTLAVLFTGAVGCSGNTAKSVEPSVAVSAIIENVEFRDKLVEAQGDVANDLYVFDDKIKDYAIYVSGSGATAEEVAVIRSDDVKTARQTVDKRVAGLKDRFEDYMPGEMAKLSDPVIMTKGDTVILVVADDSAQARKAVENLYK